MKELEYFINKLEGLLQSKGLQTRKAYFRQEQAFLSVLPIMENNEDLKNVLKRNVLTGGLISTYPFIQSICALSVNCHISLVSEYLSKSLGI